MMGAANTLTSQGDRVNFFNVRTPFFRPLWRRLATTAACLAWTVFELTSGSMMWAVVFGVSSLYLAWQFFVVFDSAPDSDVEGNGTG